MDVKKALLGAHGNYHSSVEYFESMVDLLEFRKYDVTIVTSVDDMLKEMGIPPESSSATVPKNHFDLYLMEINQGCPGEETYEPASKIYQHVKELVEGGTVKFLAISGTSEAIKVAESAGIPCRNKWNFKVLEDV